MEVTLAEANELLEYYSQVREKFGKNTESCIRLVKRQASPYHFKLKVHM